MNGLILARRYWEEVGRPIFERDCPEVLRRSAVGLVGEGSECFGYDDELSRDHDWGPGFCIWLTREDMAAFGERAKKVYETLPGEFMGFRRLRVSAMTAGRVGVMEIGSFYGSFLCLNHLPETLDDWRMIPENGLSVATNGCVFKDSVGKFTEIRERLLAYYPEDVRLKKLAARCAMAAQAGQYNYLRCLRRGERVSAAMALAQFIDHVQAVVFLLNRAYRPYYKWSHRKLAELPVLGGEVARLLTELVQDGGEKERLVEQLSALVIQELKQQGLTEGESDFLLPHAESIQKRIVDPGLRTLHLMAE